MGIKHKTKIRQYCHQSFSTGVNSMAVSSLVLAFPPGSAAQSLDYLAAKLSYYADAWDVAEDLRNGVSEIPGDRYPCRGALCGRAYSRRYQFAAPVDGRGGHGRIWIATRFTSLIVMASAATVRPRGLTNWLNRGCG
jgi:hypothetical protein